MSAVSHRGTAAAVRTGAAAVGRHPDPGPGADHRGWIRRHRLPIFFVLAFGLSWLPWPLVLLNPASSPMVPFGPLLAAIIAALLSGGWRSLARLLGQLGHWRAAPSRYLAASLVPVLVTGAAASITVASGGTIAPSPTLDRTQVLTVFATTLVLVGLFEEVGWRGYAFPALQRTMGSLRAALVIGVVWVLWHLPLLLSDPTRQRPVVPFVLLVIAQSLFFSWLYTSDKAGLVLVILSHAVVDTVARYVLPQFSGADYQLVWWCQAGLWMLVGVTAATQLVRNRASRP
ncbi:MAG TPA: type II CAAX endopeptidase family protein [Microlunatus sp.]|nr:type II CAAX endopeptidase family protein [Microlunatus sp.]